MTNKTCFVSYEQFLRRARNKQKTTMKISRKSKACFIKKVFPVAGLLRCVQVVGIHIHSFEVFEQASNNCKVLIYKLEGCYFYPEMVNWHKIKFLGNVRNDQCTVVAYYTIVRNYQRIATIERILPITR